MVIFDKVKHIKKALVMTDYWDKLEHQAAIAAMQGILSNPEFPKHSRDGYYKKNVANNAKAYAQELIKTIKKDIKWEQQETE